jgi:MFS family permease
MSALMAAGYGVIFTILDDFRDKYGISGTQNGLIIGAGFITSFIAQIGLGPLADRGHARRMVHVGVALNIIGLAMMAAGHSFWPLMLARVVMGVGIGAANPAIRRIVILDDPEHLGSRMGMLLSADVGGFALGPVVSAFLVGPFGIPGPFIAIIVATALCWPLVARVRVKEVADEDRQPERFAFDLLRNRAIAAGVILGCVAFVMIGTFDALWALVLEDLNASDFVSNVGITLFALPMIFLSPLGGWLTQRLGPFRVAGVGLTLGALFMFLYGQMPSGWWMMAITTPHSINDGLTISAAGIAVGMAAPPERQAAAQGLLGGMQTLVAGVVAGLAGVVYDQFGRTVAYSASAVLMMVLVIAGLALARPSMTMKASAAEPTPEPAAVH